MTVGSLFSGIGGIDLGLERAGFDVRWQVEIDPYCRAVLAKHWPNVRRYGDIRQLDPAQLAPVDLIAGGFPCQPVSLAGSQLAQADERWLWPEFARIVRELRPRFVLLENVPGLRLRGMGDVLGELASLGYDAEWESLPAFAFGAPHRRDRVFILAYTDRGRREVLGLEEPLGIESSRWDIVDGLGPLRELENAQNLGRPEARGRRGSWWTVEPALDRMAHGVPARVDRLRALGNAVVPQVAEFIGRAIMRAAG